MLPMQRVLSALVHRRFSLLQVFFLVGTCALALATVSGYACYVFRERIRTAACQNTFPQTRLAEEKKTPDSIAYRRKYDFSVDWFSSNIPVWQQALGEFKGKPNVHYLEIGSYEGRSAVWMLENILTAPTARLTAIDVFDGPYKEKYVANINQTDAAEKVTTITDLSQFAMRKLPLASYDIIYIDGSHAKQDVLEDAVLSWRLLKDGGILIFDDYRWAGSFGLAAIDDPTDFPKTAIDAFMQCFGDQLDVIHNSYQILVRKKTKT